MKPLLPLTLLLLALLVGLVNCRKSNVDPQLPPETMTGQHTFGCLVNGKVWIPGGTYLWGTSSLNVFYDPIYNGVFSVDAQIDKGDQRIYFKINGIKRTGTYQFPGDTTAGVIYQNIALPRLCGDFSSGYRKQEITQGQLTITRLDLTNRVIAGRFSFTLAQPGCDTIRITDGRFDMPLQ